MARNLSASSGNPRDERTDMQALCFGLITDSYPESGRIALKHNLSYKHLPPKWSQLHSLMCSKKYDTVIQNVVRSGACHGHERKTNRAILARKPQGRPDVCAPEQWRSFSSR